MIVDVSQTMLALLEFVLSKGGFDVCKANNAEEALTALKGGTKPNMVFTDLNMGAMNGIQLIRKIRKASGRQFMPIIMVTTELSKKGGMKPKSAGATG